ncbi:MAG: sn-glycerol-1-phosphate dehydrogenase [Anaerolineae bacterium]|nr:sn-glycerol-1-phosphate dehydrogenase [Anaerolineae bacterium]
MTKIDPIYVGKEAIAHLLNYVAAHGLNRFCIVADENTFPALGGRVETALKGTGYDVTSVVLEGHHIHTDEHECMQVFIRAPLGPCTFIAVGSGTITDITRFVSHRTGRAFIGMPTAPSVDGFTSIGAPIILAGVKTTILCQAPLAVFADLETLANAPQALIGAGFGDMIGKITSLADWKMGSLLWDEPYDAAIAARSQAAIDSVIHNADSIGQRSEEGVRALMDALIESGLCMLDFGTSRPASGAEHHASHYWEMKRLKEGRETQFHGAQVGYALTLVAAQYARIRAITRADLMNRLEAAALPDRAAEVENIRGGYGAMVDDIVKEHRPFLDLTEAGFDQLKHKIVDHWDDIQAIAARVPAPEVIAAALDKAGAPTTWQSLGLDADEVQPGFQYGHYLRNRFTVLKLSRVLGVPLG